MRFIIFPKGRHSGFSKPHSSLVQRSGRREAAATGPWVENRCRSTFIISFLKKWFDIEIISIWSLAGSDTEDDAVCDDMVSRVVEQANLSIRKIVQGKIRYII